MGFTDSETELGDMLMRSDCRRCLRWSHTAPLPREAQPLFLCSLLAVFLLGRVCSVPGAPAVATQSRRLRGHLSSAVAQLPVAAAALQGTSIFSNQHMPSDDLIDPSPDPLALLTRVHAHPMPSIPAGMRDRVEAKGEWAFLLSTLTR